MSSPPSPLAFGSFELQPAARQLVVDGVPAKLGARAFDLLLALVERRERVVGKNELLEVVWPGLVVEENNLQVHISALRKLLGPQAIVTVPGRGYRFCAPVPDEPAQAGNQAVTLTVHPMGHLPRPLTRFVGYEQERSECAALLQDVRLLTLTGIGGAGKTRLAIEIARDVESSFTDGVSFIDLAPLADPARLPLAVATALGLREDPNQPLEDSLARHLANQRRLLLLDNCEHVIAACAALVERLLTSASQLRVLATSREGLCIAGERTVAMRSMRVPPKEAGQGLLTYEAADLFVSLATQAAPEFELSDDNAPAVIDICRRLDGIPLALEFAAARIGLMSVEQIRAKLDDRFRLLTGNSKAISRHQTLLSTLQWSYEHLGPREQRMLQHVSLFSGGWTLGAAVAVAGVSDDLEAADLLAQLVDKSLVLTDRSATHEPRHRLLETVRQFAQDRLNESGTATAGRERHLAYYVAFADEYGPQIPTRQIKQAVERLDAELGNLLAAQAWCDQAPDGPRQGLALANALRRYWLSKGLYAQGQQFFEDALNRIPSDECSVEHGWALIGLAQVHYFKGQSQQSCDLTERAVSIARELANPRLLVFWLGFHAGTQTRLSAFGRARLGAEEALALARQLGDKDLLMRSLVTMSDLNRAEGAFQTALVDLEEAHALHRSGEDIPNHASACRLVASLSMVTGALERAREMLIESMGLILKTGTNNFQENTIGLSARLAAARGEWATAARFQGALDAYSERMGLVGIAEEFHLLPLLAKPRAMLGDSAYDADHEAGRSLTLDAALAEVLAWLQA